MCGKWVPTIFNLFHFCTTWDSIFLKKFIKMMSVTFNLKIFWEQPCNSCISSNAKKKLQQKNRLISNGFSPLIVIIMALFVCLGRIIILGKNFESMCFLTVCGYEGYDELCTGCPVRWPLCYSLLFFFFFKSIYFFPRLAIYSLKYCFVWRALGANEYSWLLHNLRHWI